MSRFTLQLPDIDYGADSELTYPDIDNTLITLPEKFMRFGTQNDKPFHCFVDDWRLESIWRHPFKMSERALISSFAVAPDFTVHENHPLPYAFYQVWRSRVVVRSETKPTPGNR